jgi:hypothetical protein
LPSRSRTSTWASLALVTTTAALPTLWTADRASAERVPTAAYLARTRTIFGEREPVATRSDPDTRSVELGVRFRADEPGWITGIRFFKTEDDTGTHTGTLWSEHGSALATGTFAGESATGWQELVFDSPVRIDRNTSYIASHHAPHGSYVHDPGGLARGATNGPLTAPADGWGASNPVYRYGDGGGVPAETWASANYWVDVRFLGSEQDPAEPTTGPTPTTTPTTPTTAPTTRPTTTTTAGPATSTTRAPSTTSTTRPTTSTTRPPSGVVLRPVDGGPDYFGRWSNSLPTDPSFFPISVWQETLADPLRDTAAYKAVGVNGYVGLWNGINPQIASAMKANGQWAFLTPGADGAPGYGREWAGNTWFDEPDGHDVCGEVGAWLRPLCTSSGGRSTPQGIAAMADAVRAVDPTRPTFGQYTKPVALDGQGLDQATRRAYVEAVDVVSFDYYPLTDPYTPGELWQQCDAVTNVRDLAGRSKPVWAFIETSRLFGANPVGRQRPTDAQIQAEVWHALIGGARGIEYFNHNFSGDPVDTQHLLIDPAYASTAAAVSRTNAQIQRLAPVLNAPYADGVLTGVTGQVSTMVKYQDGAYWLFVGSRSKSPQTVSLRLAGVADGAAEVVDENRTANVSGGVLTDSFSGETAVHIYRIR